MDLYGIYDRIAMFEARLLEENQGRKADEAKLKLERLQRRAERLEEAAYERHHQEGYGCDYDGGCD